MRGLGRPTTSEIDCIRLEVIIRVAANRNAFAKRPFLAHLPDEVRYAPVTQQKRAKHNFFCLSRYTPLHQIQ
jgi:hypothetical protein